MKRILIVGCAGSGKSTLGKKLAQKLHLPLVHLDHFHWLPGRNRRTDDAFAQLQEKACEQETWIMDGTYLRHLSTRLPYADTVIFLDLPRWLCLWHIIKRWIRCLFTGETFAPGCSQRTLSLDFWLWAWHWHKRYYWLLQAMLKNAPHAKIITLHSTQEISNFLEKAQ